MNDSAEALATQSIALALHRATVLVDRAADIHLRSRHGISYSLFSVLLIIGAHDRLTQREVADMLGVSRASITQRVAELTKRRLVHAQPHPTDARAVSLSLTTAGVELFENAWRDLETSDDDIEVGVNVPILLRELQILAMNAEASIRKTQEKGER